MTPLNTSGEKLCVRLVLLLCLACGVYGSPAQSALQFDGTNCFVSFGPATSTLGLSNFTLECWFKRTGQGSLANTGVGGISGSALIAKGRGEADANNKDCNYFLGVDTSGRLVADFEEGSTGTMVGLNHPIGGRTPCTNGVWEHGALTYDGCVLVLYVNGVFDASVEVNEPPRWDSIQYASLGAALNSTGVAQGFFEGVIDEARIWNYARSAEQIAQSMYTSINTASGLVGHWSLDDGSGLLASNSVAGSPKGILYNNPAWCPGVALVPASNMPPSVLLSSPANGATVTAGPTNLVGLTAFAADDGLVTNVSFYEDGRLLGALTNRPFTLVWTNFSPGTYTLSVAATDDTGLTTVSPPVNVTLILPNYPPVILAQGPAAGALLTNLAPRLSVTATDAEGSELRVTFLGRLNVTNPPGPDFTIVALPDTQYYNGQLASIFQTQIDWIIANRTNLNIVYVAGLGDIVNDGDAKPNEWLSATNALYRLESPALTGLPDGIPYGTVPGNHDHNNSFGGTTLYNTHFGVERFASRPWYGGHFGQDNQNHFDLVSASGLDFVMLYIDFDYSYLDYTLIDPWSDSVLKANAQRRAIVLSHDILAARGDFDPRGYAIYNHLKDNENLFLMLCGHNHGQWYRRDTNGTHVVASCLSDYQDWPNGGNGYLRTYLFSPSNNVIHVNTFSPYLNQDLTTNFNNSPSQFDIPYVMSDAKPPFQLLGATAAPAGASASTLWANLAPGCSYEWYAIVNDGTNRVTAPVRTFTTGTWSSMAAVLNRCLAPGAGGLFRARYDGVPGATYTLERAQTVNGPWIWQTNLTAPAEDQGLGVGTFEYSEIPGTNTQRFFRIVYPSYVP